MVGGFKVLGLGVPSKGSLPRFHDRVHFKGITGFYKEIPFRVHLTA